MWLHKRQTEEIPAVNAYVSLRLSNWGNRTSLTLNFPTILSSSVTFWSSSSPPFPLNRLKQWSQSSKLSNSLSSSFGYTLLDQRIHLKTHFLTFCFWLWRLSSTFSSSSFGFFFSAGSAIFFFSFLPLPLLLPFTGESSVLISEYRFVKVGWGWGEEEQRTPDMNPTWKLPKAAVTQYSKHLTEAYTTAIYISVAILGYLVVGQGPLCRQLAGSFLHKSQSHQNTVLHVVYMESSVRLFFMCVCILRPNWGVWFLSFLWTTFMVSVWTICTGQRTGRVFFPHIWKLGFM